MKAPLDMLSSDNWFHWKFNMKMTLARKGLLEHIAVAKSDADEGWQVKDMKAFAIIAQGIELQHQSEIRRATNAKQAWDTLVEFYNRANLQNRVSLTRRLHDFSMDTGSPMATHLDRFDELVVALEAVGEQVDDSRQLVILLGSLPSEYGVCISIVENAHEVNLLNVKEKLLKEYERSRAKEATEAAFKARAKASNSRGSQQRGNGKKNAKQTALTSKCFECHKRGHRAVNCPEKKRNGSDELTFMASESERDGWLLDSGASSHMTPYKSDFTVLKPLEKEIKIMIADGESLCAIGVGDVEVKVESGQCATVKDVLFIPGLDRRLMSISRITSNGLTVEFGMASCVIQKQANVVLQIPKVGNVYKLQCEAQAAMVVEHADHQSQWKLWHARLGRASEDRVRQSLNATTGIPPLSAKGGGICGGCAKGKLTVARFPTRQSQLKTTRVLELVHADVMGPMKTTSNGGARFVLLFVDDFSRYVTSYFLQKKSEVASRFLEYKNMLENQLDFRIAKVRTDNGGEFVNKAFSSICLTSGIAYQRSTPYTPQQNGVVEWMNRTVMEMARSMLHFKRVDYKWWAEAVNTTIYIVNRLPSGASPTTTPYKVCFGKAPQLGHLRVFGSPGYAHIEKENRIKLEPKSFKCMLLGYSEQSKAYRVLNCDKNKVVLTRSLVLGEREVGGIYEVDTPATTTQLVVWREDHDDGPPQDEHEAPPSGSDIDMEEAISNDGQSSDAVTTVNDRGTREQDDEHMTNADEYEHDQVVARRQGQHPSSSEMVFQPSVRSSMRSRLQPALISSSDLGETGQQQMLTQANRGVDASSRSIVLYDSTQSADGDDTSEPVARGTKRVRPDDTGDYSFIAEASYSPDTPASYRQAVSCNEKVQWKGAIEGEIAAHVRNRTWDIVPRQTGMKTVGSKWVFVKKKNERGEVIRHKARIFAFGYSQKFGVNFFETYSPVANMNSIRVILVICTHLGYVVLQFDVNTAFLNATLRELVLMEVPEGVDAPANSVCQLRKSLYGLKQSSHEWSQTIHRVLVVMGFKASSVDPCIYVLDKERTRVYLCLYVDDMLIASRTTEAITTVKQKLQTHFQLKELGIAKFVLGMEIEQDLPGRSMTMKQRQYIHDVAARFRQTGAKESDNPCNTSLKISCKDSPASDSEREAMKRKPYRSLIGCLLYISTCTRPDVSFAVCRLSRFVEDPGETHWKVAIKVLRYLMSTCEYGIKFVGRRGIPTLVAYSDADWASDIDDRRPVTGIGLLINGSPVVYKSKSQKSVALSSSEVEYVAASVCAQEIVWTRALLSDLKVEQMHPTTLYEANQGAIALMKNVGYQSRAKHIDIRVHFVRERVANNEIDVRYVESAKQVADILTKAVPTKQFHFLQKSCGTQDLSK